LENFDLSNLPLKLVAPKLLLLDRNREIALLEFRVHELSPGKGKPLFLGWAALRLSLDRWVVTRSEVLFRHLPTGNQYGLVIEDELSLPDPMVVLDADDESEVIEYLEEDPDGFYSDIIEDFLFDTLFPSVTSDVNEMFEVIKNSFEKFKLLGMSKDGEIIMKEESLHNL